MTNWNFKARTLTSYLTTEILEFLATEDGYELVADNLGTKAIWTKQLKN